MIREFKGKYRWLSNFTPCIVKLDGIAYPSIETAYQASKTLILNDRKLFKTMTSGQAKRAGRKVILRQDWEDVKLGIMEDLNRQKYSLEPWKSKLIATGDIMIQEGNTWGDTFWGVCNGIGHNHLGVIIMKIRSEIRENKNERTTSNTRTIRHNEAYYWS